MQKFLLQILNVIVFCFDNFAMKAVAIKTPQCTKKRGGMGLSWNSQLHYMYLPKYPPLKLRISGMFVKKDGEIVRDCLMPLLHVPNRNSIVRPRQQGGRGGGGLTPNFRSTPPPLKHIRQGSPIHRLSFVHYDSVKYVVSSSESKWAHLPIYISSRDSRPLVDMCFFANLNQEKVHLLCCKIAEAFPDPGIRVFIGNRRLQRSPCRFHFLSQLTAISDIAISDPIKICLMLDDQTDLQPTQC